jgi:hypothetical protein
MSKQTAVAARPPIGYLATYHYVSPDDTLAEGERPNIEVSSGFFAQLKDALDFIGDLFDGQETWEDNYVPKITGHFILCNDEFVVDDWSAGQWAIIKPYFGQDIYFSI